MLVVGSNPADDDAAARPAPRRGAVARRARRRRPAARRRRPGSPTTAPASTCSSGAGHRPRRAARPDSRARRRGAGRRRVRRRAHHGLGRRARVGRRVVARAGRARCTGVPARRPAGGRAPARGRGPGHGGRGAYVLTGRGIEQHARAPTPSPPASTWRSRSACPAAPGSGYGSLTGQGNGQGGREHGQKADQLPGYRHDRRPRGPGARRRGVGRRPRRPARARAPGRRAAVALGTPGGPRALLVHGAQPGRLARPTLGRAPSGSAGSTCSSSATSCPPRPRGSPTSCCRSPSGPRRRAP